MASAHRAQWGGGGGSKLLIHKDITSSLRSSDSTQPDQFDPKAFSKYLLTEKIFTYFQNNKIAATSNSPRQICRAENTTYSSDKFVVTTCTADDRSVAS